eukprot:GHRQ01035878.1.p1 GENE.GHRQ01035878.1~~GHRQ01035878.1.p1  ORF type:complete len:167 (-),score=6.84 GHRQ01035878.1:971-1471(-)
MCAAGDEAEWHEWSKVGDPVMHIELRRWADVLIIAPLSANSLAKLANGMCDNLVTCIARAWDFTRPLLVSAGVPRLGASVASSSTSQIISSKIYDTNQAIASRGWECELRCGPDCSLRSWLAGTCWTVCVLACLSRLSILPVYTAWRPLRRAVSLGHRPASCASIL